MVRCARLLRISAWIATIVSVRSIAEAEPIYWSPLDGGNGHFYDVVRNGLAEPWATVSSLANTSILHRAHGYLATVTSAAEKDFIVDSFGDSLRGVWLGGFQEPGSAEPGAGWQWITAEPWVYTNWDPTEPNNSGGQENYLVFGTAGSSELGVWNDLDGVTPPQEYVFGYVIEYAPDPCVLLFGDANCDCEVGAADIAIWAAQFGQTGADLTADFDENGTVGAGDYVRWAANFGNTCPMAASVPEPSTLMLAIIGFVLVVFGRPGRRLAGSLQAMVASP